MARASGRSRWGRAGGLAAASVLLSLPLVVPAVAPTSQPPSAPVAETSGTSSLDHVRQALTSNSVYVDPSAEAASLVDADSLRRQIGSAPIV